MTTTYHVERSIDAPADTVWRLLTDARSYADWNPAVVRIAGPIEPGATIELVSSVSPGRTFALDVTEFTPPRRMVWADGMPLGLFRGVRTFSLDERSATTTFTMQEVFSGPLAPLITRAIPDMTRSFEQFADGLKRAAEAAVRS